MYYAPGSLKAKLCVEGNAKMYDYCESRDIPYERCGKVIVAADEEEIPRLKEIFRRGKENKVVGLSWLNAEELKKVEPHCCGVAAVFCTSTGITDYKQVRPHARGVFARAKTTLELFTFLWGHPLAHVRPAG